MNYCDYCMAERRSGRWLAIGLGILAAALVLAFGMAARGAPPSDVWLTQTVSGGNSATLWGSSAGSPFYVGGYAAYTAILETNYPNMTFHYAPGTYQILANQAVVHSGCAHLGSGADSTIIQQVPGPVNSIGTLFSGGDVTNFSLRDLTLDCNASNNYYYTNSGVLVALPIYINPGSGILLSNIHEMGFGRNDGAEYIPGLYGGSNIVVDGCWADKPVVFSNGGCPFVLAGLGSAISPNLIIKNSSVSNMPYLTQCFSATTVSNCLAAYCGGNGIYYEPGYVHDDITDYYVISNRFINCLHGVYIAYPPSKTIQSLTITGNHFTIPCSITNGNITSAILEWSDSPRGNTGTLTVNNNLIDQVGNCGIVSNLYPIDFGYATTLNASGNQFVLSSYSKGPITVDTSTVGYLCLHGNIDENGGLVAVMDQNGVVWAQNQISACGKKYLRIRKN